MENKLVVVDSVTYNLAPIKVGQMRDITRERTKNPDGDYLDDNLKIVKCCLNNAGGNYTEKDIEEMSYAAYRPVLNVALELSGFVTTGEIKAVGTLA